MHDEGLQLEPVTQMSSVKKLFLKILKKKPVAESLL